MFTLLLFNRSQTHWLSQSNNFVHNNCLYKSLYEHILPLWPRPVIIESYDNSYDFVRVLLQQRGGDAVHFFACMRNKFLLLQFSLQHLLINSLSLVLLKKQIKEDHNRPIFSLISSVRRQTSGIHCFSDLLLVECALYTLLGTRLFVF